MTHPALTALHDHLLQTHAWLNRELAGLRTGRASPALIEHVPVACYDSSSPLQQVAAIHSPEPQVLVVQPWDPSLVKDVEKALQQSALGITPVVDGKIIRLPFPPMTQERRQELTKLVKDKGEQAKVRVRTARETSHKHVRQDERDGSLSEDALKLAEKELQLAVDQAGQAIDAAVRQKITEVETV